MTTATTETLTDDPHALARLLIQVERYLGVVDAYRREGCEPRWLPETETGRGGSSTARRRPSASRRP
jgi:hypothetical protein